MNFFPTITSATKKELYKKLGLSLCYAVVGYLFRMVFIAITPLYINASSGMKKPIDALFFAADCVKKAKVSEYNIKGYFQAYLPLDIAFPVFYTIMFFTLISIFRNKELYYDGYKKFYQVCWWLIIAGGAFDLLENGMFSLYLGSSLELSTVVALITSVKIILFAANILCFLAGFVIASLILWKNR